MIYLTGSTNAEDEPNLICSGIGLMIQPGNSYHLRASRYPFHAADNGCYNDRWEEDRWLRWLDHLVPRNRCLFATAPDVYPDAVATLERSAGYFDLIRELGFPVALVAQDGAEALTLPWDDFDCLFVGGERTDNPRDEWKLCDAAAGLVRFARDAGKWVHMGRVNSLARLFRAAEMGCNSVDGTFLKYRRRKKGGGTTARGAVELTRWLRIVNDTPTLFPFETPSLAVHKDANV